MGAWVTGLVDAESKVEPADVLASLAAAVGVAWDGPGRARIDIGALPDLPGWELLDAAREALLAPARRRRLGAHHTPPAVASRLAAIALTDARPGALVLDPACGGGAFLVAAARLRPDVVVHGIDVDPLAVATCRAALACAAPEVEARVRVGDGLAQPWEADVVLGNPPFLSPLGSATAGTVAAARLRRELASPYADVAWLFLHLAAARVRAGGRVTLVQPESLLTARDAASIRSRLTARLSGLWVAGEPVFGASVRVCAPVVEASAAGGPVRRWRGSGVRPAPAMPLDRAASNWGRLRPHDAPSPRATRGRAMPSAGVIGDLATATAGFRDEFYGLAALVTEGGPGHPLVSCGLIDPGRLLWGERLARIGGARYLAPTVGLAAVDDERLKTWIEARLVPKVLVATQTKVLEAVADPEGRCIPLTPVLAVLPRDPTDVWQLAAALTSPHVSAWALREHGGSALSGEAVKLSSRQVLQAPLPADPACWAAATAALQAGDVDACAARLAEGDPVLLDWWRRRRPTR